METTLANLLRFIWKCYWRKKQKKKKKKKGKKGKKKANKDLAATMKNPERRDSLMVGAAASTAKGSKVTVKDME